MQGHFPHQRTRKATHIFIVVTLLVAIFLTPQPANACSCFSADSIYHPSQLVGQYDAVFVGQVVSDFAVQDVPGFSSSSSWLGYPWVRKIPGIHLLYRKYATLEVVDSWKGVVTKRITMLNGDGVSCSNVFQPSKEHYLIFANERDGRYYSSFCSTAIVSSERAQNTLNYLETLPTIPLTWMRPVNMILIGSVTILFCFMLFAFRRKNLKRSSSWQQFALFGGMGIAILLIVNGLKMEPIQKKIETQISEVSIAQADLDKAKPLASRGSFWFVSVSFNCITCHHFNRSDSPESTLRGLYGQQVRLADGTTIIADEVYIRNAIIDPEKHSYDGFIPDPMPYGYERFFIEKDQFRDIEADVLSDIVEFIKTLEESE